MDESSDRIEHLEIEHSFAVPRRWTMPKLIGVAGVVRLGQVARMTQTATYLDTPDLALLAARHTLRRRTGGTDAGWHLKQPAGGADRLETHVEPGRAAAMVPMQLRAAVADIIGTRVLMPVCVLRTRRVRRPLLAADDTVLALVEDDTVEATTLRGGERVVRWREIEVELVEGTREDLAEICAVLQRSGLTASELPSKLARALSEAGVDHPRNDPSAGAVVLRFLERQVGMLQSLQAALRADEPEAVHQARVATRRLRSALRTFAPLLDRSVTDPLRREIAWLTGVLGAPRDAEVLRDRLMGVAESLPAELVRGPVLARMRRSLHEDHARAHADLVTALNGRRHERLMASLVEMLVDPPVGDDASAPAAVALTPLVAKASRRVEKTAEVARTVTDPVAAQEAIHDIRKEAKAARYAAEAAGSAAGSSAKKVARAWSALQEALGDHQDSVVAREALEVICAAARKAGEDTFTYGVLVEREVAGAQAVQAQYERLLNEARHAAKKLRRR